MTIGKEGDNSKSLCLFIDSCFREWFVIECSKWEGEISIECKREKGLNEID